MTRVRAIRLVATFDLLESLRSRKALALLFIYAAFSLGGAGLFIRALGQLQDELREQFGDAVTMETLMQSEEFIELVTKAAGNEEIARAIVMIPPLALFYGWFATNFVPLLVLLTSSDAISTDVSSGSVRFSLFRVDRLSWAIGKLLGQTLLMAVGVVFGALGTWVVGLIWLEGMDVGSSLWWLLRLSLRSIVYSFAYLGIAMCASQLVRTNNAARGSALGLMFFCSLAGGIIGAPAIQESSPTLMMVLWKIFPNGHSLHLWHPDFGIRTGTMLGLIAIGVAWFALGYWRFSRRDA